MPNTEAYLLTIKDYTILEVMLEQPTGRDDAMKAILRRKVSSATVMFRDDIPPIVVTLSSRVVFRIDDGPAETRIIAHDAMRGLVGMLLPITGPRGLALLGLGEGQSMTIPTRDGGIETLTVEKVVYQPEAARRRAEKLGRAAGPSRPRGAVLRVGHAPDRQDFHHASGQIAET